MQILSQIPSSLRGRGHNHCIPVRCDCGADFLVPISDGRKIDPEATTFAAHCPMCLQLSSLPIPPEGLSAITRNGQEA